MDERAGAGRPLAAHPLAAARRLYQESFLACLPLALFEAAIGAGLGLYSGGGRAASFSALDASLQSPGQWAANLVALLVWIVVGAAIIVRQEALASDREVTLGAAIGRVMRRLPAALLAAAAWAVAIFAGLLLFVVPGVWLSGKWQLWPVAMFAEQTGPWQALARSWRLTDRHWWRASTVTGMAAVVACVLSLPAIGSAAVAVTLQGAALTRALAWSTLLSAAASVFTLPMLTAAMVAAYRDLQLRDRGNDSTSYGRLCEATRSRLAR